MKITPTGIENHFDRLIKVARNERWVERLWEKDATLWSQDPVTQKAIKHRLGWLDTKQWMVQHQKRIELFSASARKQFKHVVILGMGGSSLCSDVFSHIFKMKFQDPKLFILDSTDPYTIRGLENQIDLQSTLFIVASKSGTTLEVEALRRYFEAKVTNKSQFISITDPHTPLANSLNKNEGYLDTFLNAPDIGGRFSALSYFGFVPAACMGVPVNTIMDNAITMINQCHLTSIEDNPGFLLGIFLGASYLSNKNKLTLLQSATFNPLGIWIEQLIAESTGKNGLGILPIVDEPQLTEADYSFDRIFVASNTSLDHLSKHHPTFETTIDSVTGLGGLFFQWQIATAVSGIILEINPFNEPNVNQSKDNTRSLLDSEEELRFANIEAKVKAVSSPLNTMESFLKGIKSPEYLGILAYLEPSETNQAKLRKFALKYKVPFSIGFGPRFLHSTGQFHKGGPNQGRFIQLTCSNDPLPIPGFKFGFETLKLTQALGDFEAMKSLNRNIINIHLKSHDLSDFS